MHHAGTGEEVSNIDIVNGRQEDVQKDRLPGSKHCQLEDSGLATLCQPMLLNKHLECEHGMWMVILCELLNL